MRGLIIVSLFAIAACGPSKPPADASDVKDNDSTPKWDSSSETASNPTPTKPPPSADSTSDSTSTSTPTSTPSWTSPTPTAGPHLPPDFGGRSYDRASTEIVLNRSARQVKENCGYAKDDTGKPSGPWGKGTVTITLGHNGHSKGATIGPPFDGKQAGKCAVQAFTNLTYAPFAGADTSVDWEVEIVKPTGK